MGTDHAGSNSLPLENCQCLECAAKYNATNQLEKSLCPTYSIWIEVVARQGERSSLSTSPQWLLYPSILDLRKVGAAAGSAL